MDSKFNGVVSLSVEVIFAFISVICVYMFFM